MTQTEFGKRPDIVALEEFASKLPHDLREDLYKQICHFKYIGETVCVERTEAAQPYLHLEYTIYLLKKLSESKANKILVRTALDEVSTYSFTERESFLYALKFHPDEILLDITCSVTNWVAFRTKTLGKDILQPSTDIAELILRAFNTNFAGEIANIC